MESLRQSTPQTDTSTPSAYLVLVEPASGYQKVIKPILDRVFGTLFLVLSLPILLAGALLVAISVGRPIIYRQTRVGRNGTTFELLKLRTMIPDRRKSEELFDGPDRRQTHKSPEDPRVPRLGKVVRALRLDELPQLWNVVRGDMSLVGPRPELPSIVAEYEPWQHHRHSVKPGLTGLWQVEAPEGRLMHECTDLDLTYIENMSLRTDLKILARTPGVVISRQGF